MSCRRLALLLENRTPYLLENQAGSYLLEITNAAICGTHLGGVVQVNDTKNQLYLDQENYIRWLHMTDTTTGETITDATVTADLKAENGDILQTIILNPDPEYGGNYQGYFIPLDPLNEGTKFYVEVSADSDIRTGYWKLPVRTLWNGADEIISLNFQAGGLTSHIYLQETFYAMWNYLEDPLTREPIEDAIVTCTVTDDAQTTLATFQLLHNQSGIYLGAQAPIPELTLGQKYWVDIVAVFGIRQFHRRLRVRAVYHTGDDTFMINDTAPRLYLGDELHVQWNNPPIFYRDTLDTVDCTVLDSTGTPLTTFPLTKVSDDPPVYKARALPPDPDYTLRDTYHVELKATVPFTTYGTVYYHRRMLARAVYRGRDTYAYINEDTYIHSLEGNSIWWKDLKDFLTNEFIDRASPVAYFWEDGDEANKIGPILLDWQRDTGGDYLGATGVQAATASQGKLYYIEMILDDGTYKFYRRFPFRVRYHGRATNANLHTG